MKQFFCLVLLIISNAASGQDTIYLDSSLIKTNKEEAVYYSLKEYSGKDSYKFISKTFYLNGKTKKIEYVEDAHPGKTTSIDSSFYENGQLEKTLAINKGKKEGDFLIYWPNGKMKRKEKYSEGKRIEEHCYDSTGSATTFFEYEIMPQFPGGEKGLIWFLQNRIVYPKKARRRDIEGIVYIGFVIKKDGSVSKIKIIRSPDSLLSDEAIRVIETMPSWIPGLQDNIPVDVQFNMPINFRLR